MYLSIVIPVFNEVESIAVLLAEIGPVLGKVKKKSEVIVVDDGSSDGTLDVLKKLKKKYSWLKIVVFRGNFGQTAALSAGFDLAEGEVIVAMDGDGQNDPRDIPKLVKKLEQGFDVVSGWRKDRQDKRVTRVLPSKLANGLISWISGVKLNDFGCTLKAYRKSVLDDVRLYGDMHRFIPAVASAVGARITEMEVRHYAREFGESKYGMGRTVKVLLDVLTVKFLLTYQTRPLQLFGRIGLVLGGFGGIVFLKLVYERLVLQSPLADRPLFFVSIFFVLVGIQLMTIGVLAEMLSRVYYESQGKKIYYIRKILD